jgi:hypothetical protein
MPDDDLSKWKLDTWIDVPEPSFPSQKVMVQTANDWDGEDGTDIEIFMQDFGTETSVLVSLDDAENFATLILYEVKRAKGEL